MLTLNNSEQGISSRMLQNERQYFESGDDSAGNIGATVHNVIELLEAIFSFDQLRSNKILHS